MPKSRNTSSVYEGVRRIMVILSVRYDANKGGPLNIVMLIRESGPMTPHFKAPSSTRGGAIKMPTQ